MNFLRGFLDNDSVFGQLMGRCGILIAANLLFALCTIPVVTIGPGLAALDYTLLRSLRNDGDINPIREFWSGFRDNFRQASLCWLAILAILAFLALEWYWCGQFGGPFLVLRLGLVMIAAAVVLLALYLFPVMASFSASVPTLVRSSLYFAFRKPLYLLVILFFNLFPLYLTYSDLTNLPLYAFLWCVIGFAAVRMLTVTLLLREFSPFLAPSPDAVPDAEPSQAEILDDMRKLGM